MPQASPFVRQSYLQGNQLTTAVALGRFSVRQLDNRKWITWPESDRCLTESHFCRTGRADHSRYRRQRLDRRSLIEHAEHRVRVHRQVDVGVAGKELGGLGRNAGA